MAAFTGGLDVPSARFRVRQYIRKLRSERVDLTEYTAPFGAYPPRQGFLRPLWAASTLASRIPGIIMSHRYDVTLLQREMLSTFFTLEPLTRRPRVLDVDDAIWALRGGAFAARLAASCDVVICGNSFLADHFCRANSRVTIIPTAVDTSRYVPLEAVDEPVIGWSGTSWSLRYLYGIESALAAALDRVPHARLRVVCNARPEFRKIPGDRLEFIRWSPAVEVSAIQGMAIGIMPVEDSVWARGKCSYKMLTYMACGIPVVVSPVGMNAEVLASGHVGIGADGADGWIESLSFLAADKQERLNLGMAGRQLVLDRYSLDELAVTLAKTLRGVAGE